MSRICKLKRLEKWKAQNFLYSFPQFFYKQINSKLRFDQIIVPKKWDKTDRKGFKKMAIIDKKELERQRFLEMESFLYSNVSILWITRIENIQMKQNE